MNQGVGVDALDGTRQKHSCLMSASTGFGRGKHQRRSHPLTSGEEGITHGLMNRGGLSGGLRKQSVQGSINLESLRGDPRSKVEVGHPTR